MVAGFLVVFSEPGSQVSLEEFQDWYNNEHVPLRMNHLPSFHTGARFSASDSLKPSWLALYDIDDTSTFQHESYTRLRANRSPREANLVGRLELLDRRTYEVLADSGESTKTSSLASSNPTNFVVTHGVIIATGQGISIWTKETFQQLTGVKGWVRTRIFKCIDNLKTGTAIVGKGPEVQAVSQYLVLHELENSSAGESSEFKDIVGVFPEGSVEIGELRTWSLYRAYPGIAQGNLGK
ncbi:hypothetical protein D9615_009794 [Tricholomella constricta]|uniref:EthD domain-containing protein n=1 Tax=Tricholomella constricta TaxID=117010 RepID=A0A8H5GTI1_9AGAR|nr:hypothetical protein D9615_009794 [Tricholomella constricta]